MGHHINLAVTTSDPPFFSCLCLALVGFHQFHFDTPCKLVSSFQLLIKHLFYFIMLATGPPEPSSEAGASASPLARLMLALHAARKPGYQSATEIPECEAPLSSRATLVPELAGTSSASLDRSMEIWAQAHLGVIRVRR